jgi:hypothetical protein
MKKVDKIIVYYTDGTFEEVRGVQQPDIPKLVGIYEHLCTPTSNTSLLL